MTETTRIALALLLFLAPPALAAERTPLDFSVKTGVTAGKLIRELSTAEGIDKPAMELDYGGLPLAGALNIDLSRSFTMSAEIHFIADFLNVQLTETGVHVGLAYHLLGGSRRVSTDLGYAEIVHREPYNFSLLFRVAYSHFNASPRLNPTVEEVVNGSAFESMAGIQFRQDIGERSALALEGFLTVSSLPATSERVKTNRMEFILSYRFFL